MESFTLNDYERKLIEENINLAYWKARKWTAALNNPSLLDEIISLCEYALIKAIHSWDCTRKTKLITYAAVCMDNQVKIYLRQNKNNAIPISSFTTIDNEEIPIEVLGLNTENKVDIEQLIDLEELLESLPDREYSILYMYYYVGYNEREIAEMIKISQSYVSRIKRGTLNHLKKKINRKTLQMS
jgi:RNA polymerase sporulation-specific sigma factor